MQLVYSWCLYMEAIHSTHWKVSVHTFSSVSNHRCFPPTEDAFRLHLLRCLIATLEQKRAHLPDPNLPSATEFGWRQGIGHLEPVPLLEAPFPAITQTVKGCNCIASKCRLRCSCKQNQVACCIACKCEGKREKCDRVGNLETLDDSGDSDDESDLADDARYE